MSPGLLQQDIFRLLKYGTPDGKTRWEFFYEIISDEIDLIASHFGCQAEISEIKLLDAQSFWLHDLKSLRVTESEEPDHFKHAGWLCHWLRKKSIISRLTIFQEDRLTDVFAENFNEYTAFAIGLKLVIFLECCERGLSDAAIAKSTASAGIPTLIRDVAVYLSHKNVSPHAIYLIYKSLMHQIPIVGSGKEDIRGVKETQAAHSWRSSFILDPKM